jgi:hypothetical protein
MTLLKGATHTIGGRETAFKSSSDDEASGCEGLDGRGIRLGTLSLVRVTFT